MTALSIYLLGLSRSRSVVNEPTVRRLLLHSLGQPIVASLRALMWAGLAVGAGMLLLALDVPGGLLLLSVGPLGAAAVAAWSVSRSFEQDRRHAGHL